MVDGIILAGLIAGITLGFKDGFFRKLYGILGFLGGICAALFAYTFVGEWFSSWFELSPEISRLLAFAFIFTFFVVVLNVLYRMMGTDKGKAVAVWSRFGGGFIGAFQGALIVSLLLMIANRMELLDEQMKKESMLYEDIVEFAPKVMTYSMKWLPKSQEFLAELKGKL